MFERRCSCVCAFIFCAVAGQRCNADFFACCCLRMDTTNHLPGNTKVRSFQDSGYVILECQSRSGTLCNFGKVRGCSRVLIPLQQLSRHDKGSAIWIRIYRLQLRLKTWLRNWKGHFYVKGNGACTFQPPSRNTHVCMPLVAIFFDGGGHTIRM